MKITQADTPTIQTNWCPHLCHPYHFYAGCPSWHNPPNLSWLGTGTKYAGLHTRDGLVKLNLDSLIDCAFSILWLLCLCDNCAVQVVLSSRRTCFECLGNIFTLLPWREIMRFYCQHEPAEIVTRLHVCLLTLLVHLGSERAIVEVLTDL